MLEIIKLLKIKVLKIMERRKFIGGAFLGLTGVGVVFSLAAMKKTWNPLPKVYEAGFTDFDLKSIKKETGLTTILWRGKPIFIFKHKKEDKLVKGRYIEYENYKYMIAIGLCTHLGCIPAWQPKENIFHCPCHGGVFNASGINQEGTPPPRPLDIPPFDMKGSLLTFGKVGQTYKDMVKKG